MHEQDAVDRGIRQRQIENSSTSAASVGRAVGHFRTPWAAGMKAMQRSESSRKSPR